MNCTTRVLALSLYVMLAWAETPCIPESTQLFFFNYSDPVYQELLLAGGLDDQALAEEMRSIRNDRNAQGEFKMRSGEVAIRIRRLEQFRYEAVVQNKSLIVDAQLKYQQQFKDFHIEQRLIFDQFQPAYTPNLELGLFEGTCRVTVQRYKRETNHARSNQQPKEERKEDQYTVTWKLTTRSGSNSYVFEIPNGLPSGLLGRSYYWHDIPYKLYIK